MTMEQALLSKQWEPLFQYQVRMFTAKTCLITIALFFSIAIAASLLLMVYADGVEYAELTASVIQSLTLRYERLLNTTEDTKIQGLFAINVVIHVLGFDDAIHFALIL